MGPLSPADVDGMHGISTSLRSSRDEGQEPAVSINGTLHVLSADAAELVAQLIDMAAASAGDGDADQHSQITTGQAADLLGVSRPTVVALIDKGELKASRVGTRRRLIRRDVLAYRLAAETGRTSSRAKLTALSEELGLYDS